MNLISSLRCFSKLLAEDVAMTRLGAPRGWLLRMHYYGRWAARRHQAAPPESVTLNVRGRRLEMDLSAAYEGAFNGIFLDNEYDCASLVQEPPKRILDLGANIGMGSLYLSALFSEAQFVCVEPDPRNVPLLERNLRANGVRAQVMACAVGAKSGESNLRFGDNPTCSALEAMPIYDRTKLTPVTVRTVPDILALAGWDSAGLVKLDVEGTEDESAFDQQLLVAASTDFAARNPSQHDCATHSVLSESIRHEFAETGKWA